MVMNILFTFFPTFFEYTFDDFSKWLMDEEALKNVQYVLFDEYGRPRKCLGGHILIDGGYLKHACFICFVHKIIDVQLQLFIGLS